jgi:hypothetical protein
MGWFKRGQITRDHIFSRSWNPDKRPTHQWTVGACHNCNGAFGKIEIALRDQLAICLAQTGCGSEIKFFAATTTPARDAERLKRN